jgi:hypothetical protein
MGSSPTVLARMFPVTFYFLFHQGTHCGTGGDGSKGVGKVVARSLSATIFRKAIDIPMAWTPPVLRANWFLLFDIHDHFEREIIKPIPLFGCNELLGGIVIIPRLCVLTAT